MNDSDSPPQKFEFRRSLKDAHRYPVLKPLRIERFWTRPLASLVVRAVFRSRVMPDHLTWAAFVMGLAGAAAFLDGSYTYFIVGGILVQLGSILDCADGMLARARDQSTERGAFLDLMLDRIIDFIVLGALTVGTYRCLGSLAVVITALIATALNFLQATLYYLLLIYRKDQRMGRQAEVRGFAIFLLMLFSVLNRPHYFFYALFGEALISIFYQAFRFFRPARG
ncbi:MAG: CDP-alcohol phosphatidyltransferase family protein [Candidatus Aminicenantes bacterium]|nr:CDP-alcohol phosphatidyltransferase family protein [Candidatus Aminicenantes bacterium]